jgi:hypothetical protein
MAKPSWGLVLGLAIFVGCERSESPPSIPLPPAPIVRTGPSRADLKGQFEAERKLLSDGEARLEKLTGMVEHLKASGELHIENTRKAVQIGVARGEDLARAMRTVDDNDAAGQRGLIKIAAENERRRKDIVQLEEAIAGLSK